MHLGDFELIEAGCLFLLTLNLSESFKGSLLESLSCIACTVDCVCSNSLKLASLVSTLVSSCLYQTINSFFQYRYFIVNFIHNPV